MVDSPVTSPWSQIVAADPPPEEFSGENRSPENEASGSSDNGDNNGVDNGASNGSSKRTVWNKPLVNGVSVEASNVMGDDVAWPALSESLSESTRSKASNLDSSKILTNGSIAVSQGPISQLPQKQGNSNANSHSNANHAKPARQRSMKHRSSGSGPGGGPNQSGYGRSTPPPPPPPPLPPPFPVMPYGNVVPHVLEPRVRGPRHVAGVSSQLHPANDQSSNRNSNRKGNFGGRPRGDGYYSNRGGRRDQDRRDAQITPQFGPPPGGFIPPHSPGSGPFMPPPLRPFVGQMAYDMPPQIIYVPTMPPESFRGMPIVPPPPPPPFFFPPMDPSLPPSVVKQIEYYFSDDNLAKDDFLRSKMDEEGWIPIELIANFPRVRNLTNNIQFILDCLRASMLVEVQDDSIRRRDDWKKWVHTSSHLAARAG